MNISVINHTEIADADAQRVLRAVNRQIEGDFAPYWSLSAQLRLDFKLALVPSTPPIRAIYQEAQQALRAIGCNACVFDDAAAAAEWLEGRAVAGRYAS